MEIAEYVRELLEIDTQLKLAGWVDSVDRSTAALGILKERGKDRRMAEIRAERKNGIGQQAGQPAKPAPKPKTLEEVRHDLGQLAGAVDLSVGVDGVYIKVKKGPDFNNAVKKLKELGGKYHPETYEWVI